MQELKEPEYPLVVSFKRRFFADLIDAIFLGIVGWSLYLISPSTVHALGHYGALVGLAISFTYAGFLNSSAMHGQTVGKKVLKIRVIAAEGGDLPLRRSFLRYGFIAFLFYINSLALLLNHGLTPTLQMLAGTLLGVLLILDFLGVVPLTILHPAKRGLHDLLAGSLVVYAGRIPTDEEREALLAMPAAAAMKKVGFFAGLTILLGGGCVWGVYQSLDGMKQNLQAAQLLMTDLQAKGLEVNSVNVNTFTMHSAGKTTQTVTLYVGINSEAPEDADKAYTEAVRIFPGLDTISKIRIGRSSGWNLGIAKYVTTRWTLRDPKDPSKKQDDGYNTQI